MQSYLALLFLNKLQMNTPSLQIKLDVIISNLLDDTDNDYNNE